MRIIIGTEYDGTFNLAVEEYLLRTEDDDVFMLWQNKNTVVIGRNQNAWAEIDLPYAQAHGVQVVRRLSGGGAVYHDLGNVNFTFITAAKSGQQVDFSPFTAPIIRALAELGVDAALDGRNDILAGGAKISGNAQCTYRRPDGTARLLHHGTLLLSSDLTRLTSLLRPRPEKLRARGIRSVRSRVTNLTDLPGFPPLTAAELIEHLARSAAPGGDLRQVGDLRPLSEAECDAVRALQREKYGTWEWNFGASAAHETEYTARFPFGTLSAAYSVKEGKITDLRLWGDYFGTAPVDVLEAALRGTELRRDAVANALEHTQPPVSACIAGAKTDDLVSLILGETQEGEENG